jgi:hypothetical protein
MYAIGGCHECAIEKLRTEKLQTENKALTEDLKQKDDIIAEHVALNEKLQHYNKILKSEVDEHRTSNGMNPKYGKCLAEIKEKE